MQKKKKGKGKITLEDLFEVTQNSFGKLESKLTQEIRDLKQDVGELKEDVVGLKEKVDEVIDTQDKILKDVEDLKDENIMDMGFRDRFDKLEGRVETIEVKLRSNKNRG